ncbi:MAG: TRAP transporter substrate-binding protein [Alphaproteobacteria bacterium]|nr:TRAP transporter substrate-binding protein [Alphaproteobacteria bacterium]
MSKSQPPSRRALLSATAAGLVAAPAILSKPLHAAESQAVRMVTSWPQGAPGPGWSADRLADRITRMSGGALTVKVFGAGSLVPALEVFDAVGAGTAEIAHTASLFWRGKTPAAPLFTAGPFGLTAVEHNAWIHHGGGQDLWDALYAPFNLKPFMAGNSGMQMGGWFNREITSLSDLAGLKMRIPGLGGAIFEKLGGAPVTLPPGEIFGALQSGLIDGAEFLGPWSDSAFGFQKVARYYYRPGFHEPNGTAEALVNRDWFAGLSDAHRAIVAEACTAENSVGLAEAEWNNADALRRLIEEDDVTLRDWPDDVLRAAKSAAEEVLDDLAATGNLAGRIVASFREARDRAARWGRVGYESFFRARGLS